MQAAWRLFGNSPGLTDFKIDSQERAMTEKKVPTSSTAKKSGSRPAAAKKASPAIVEKEAEPKGGETALSTTVTTVTTSALKSQFAAGSIPLSTDFGNLIDIAECGRRAIGQSADQTDNSIGVGLALATDDDAANKGKLSVKAANGIGSDSTGVYVKPAKGIAVDTSGVNVKTGNGITVDANNCVALDFATVLPKGMIMMYSPPSGTTTIPAGWVLCDGNNSTPNLVDRFILGGTLSTFGGKTAATMSGSDTTAKSFSATSDNGDLNVSAGIDETVLEISQIPSHGHNVTLPDGVGLYVTNYNLGGSGKVALPSTYNDGQKEHVDYHYSANDVGGNGGHSHGVHVGNQAHTHLTSIIPPYYILAFIMKT
jgi:microcystin-dependent protein